MCVCVCVCVCVKGELVSDMLNGSFKRLFAGGPVFLRVDPYFRYRIGAFDPLGTPKDPVQNRSLERYTFSFVCFQGKVPYSICEQKRS